MATDKSSPFNPDQTGRLLDATANSIELILDAVPKEVLNWHDDPDEWCIQQVLGHLIATEQGSFTDRIRKMLAEQDPQLVSLNLANETEVRRDCERDGLQLFKEFQLLRKNSCTLVAALIDDDLQRGGLHPVIGYVTISDLLHELIYHDLDHMRQILNNIQRYTWSHLGNTQQFH